MLYPSLLHIENQYSKLLDNHPDIRVGVNLKDRHFLRVSSISELFYDAQDVDLLADLLILCWKDQIPVRLLGHGSNILPSDDGVKGLVITNHCKKLEELSGGIFMVDSGISFQDLFLHLLHCGYGGLEFAVGIPGTLGGALVSNAGAYRNNISKFVEALEVMDHGVRKWVSPDWMEFSYRDSKLRKNSKNSIYILRVQMKFDKKNPWSSYLEAKDYQFQRIKKQPPQPSVGSFFKNVYDKKLANKLENLPVFLKDAGVVPAGFLIMDAGLAGMQFGGARFSQKHANFIINVRNASASEIRELACIAKKKVYEKHGAILEEEVLYIGKWEEKSTV